MPLGGLKAGTLSRQNARHYLRRHLYALDPKGCIDQLGLQDAEAQPPAPVTAEETPGTGYREAYRSPNGACADDLEAPDVGLES